MVSSCIKMLERDDVDAVCEKNGPCSYDRGLTHLLVLAAVLFGLMYPFAALFMQFCSPACADGPLLFLDALSSCTRIDMREQEIVFIQIIRCRHDSGGHGRCISVALLSRFRGLRFCHGQLSL